LLAINLVSAAVYSFSGHYNTRSFSLSSLQLCVHKSEEEEEPARRLGRLTDGRTDGQAGFWRTGQSTSSVEKFQSEAAYECTTRSGRDMRKYRVVWGEIQIHGIISNLILRNFVSAKFSQTILEL
jgi:hypothetical protein